MLDTVEQHPKIDETTHLFRRQFLLGPKSFAPNDNWSVISLASGLELSHHVDLPVAISRRDNGVLALIGIAVNPFEPSATADDLLNQVQVPTDITAQYLIETTDRWSGRWCFLCLNDSQRVAISDPCALRAVHYFQSAEGLWCGSQPEIIRTQVELAPDEGVLAYAEAVKKGGQEPSMIGCRTDYDKCHALLPNQSINLETGEVNRFFPIEPLSPIDTKEALDIAVRCMRGGLEGILNFARISIPVTAGYESRALLAASKPFQSKCDYFVDRKDELPMDHPDVWVPQKVCADVGVPFSVENSNIKPDQEFLAMLRHNVTGGRDIPKTMMIYRKFLEQDQRININGNGSEVCRFLYDPYRVRTKHKYTGEYVAKLLKVPVTEYSLEQFDGWLDDIADARSKGYLVLDLAYWEQRMGRWGALYPAEQDIQIEEFSPFNNRFLLRTLLRVPAHLRCAPKYTFYRDMMKAMWPEVMGHPFNPRSWREAWRTWAYKRLPDPVQEALVAAKRVLRSALRR